MNAIKKFAPEWTKFTDERSGTILTQLTNYRCHSHHFYFTNDGWYDNGSQLLFGSDRDNETNLFSINLNDGSISQVTRVDPPAMFGELNFQGACLNPKMPEVYFWHDKKIISVNLHTLETRVLQELAPGFRPSILSCSADGKFVCSGIYEDLSDRIKIDLERGYKGFGAIHTAKPLSKILKIPVDGSDSEIVWEERYWIGHVNASPTRAHLATFCHEGPWHAVDHRIWGLNLETGDAWKIRECNEGEAIGHEYWLADGEHLGYHGSTRDGKHHFIGFISYDNNEKVEANFPWQTGHVHSLDQTLIVGDAGSIVRLWWWDKDEQEYVGPHCLCEHKCSAHVQKLHVHPRFTNDGSKVLFTSDMSGYGNIYLVDLPKAELISNLPFEIL